MRIKTFLLTLLVMTTAWAGAYGQERLESLELGPIVYEDVEVLSKTPTDLFITHSKGSCNIKVSDLDDPTRVKLGYEPLGAARGGHGPIELKTVEMDPRVQEMNVKMAEEFETMLKQVPPATILGVLGGTLVFYLFFCFCLKLICEKAGGEPTLLVWVPVLQLFPMFRAARMSSWSVPLMFAPQLFLAIASIKLPSDLSANSSSGMMFIGLFLLTMAVPMVISIIWCFKISVARGKSPFIGVLLLLPLTNILAFLYLAFSGTEDEEAVNPAFVTFN